MAAPEVILLLRWLHLAFAIGWMGATIFFDLVLGPVLGRLTAPARSELLVRLIPKALRYFNAFSLLTLLAGFGLAASLTDGNLSFFFTGNPWGSRILVGGSISLITGIIAMGVISPAANRIVRILSQQPAPAAPPTQGPPPQLLSAQRRLQAGSMASLLLLFIVLVFMVWARFP